MKIKVNKITFRNEVKTQFGIMYGYNVNYLNIDTNVERWGSFLAKEKDKPAFIEGQEYEVQETEKEHNGQNYYSIKPFKTATNSQYAKAKTREQTKYSGFAVSYVKDLFVQGVIIEEDDIKLMNTWKRLSTEIFWHMVELDRNLES
jgi:hypothetical protein